jgi:hypothetical protein
MDGKVIGILEADHQNRTGEPLLKQVLCPPGDGL